MRKQSIKTNFIFNLCYQILVIILPLVTTPYVSRVLGAHEVGVYSHTQAFANYFYLFAMLGVNNYGNRTIAQVGDNKEERSKTFCEIYVFQLGVAILVSVIYFLYCLYCAGEQKIILLMQFFYVISGAIDINWFCFGMEKFKLTTIRSTIVRIVAAIAIFVFVRNQNDLWVYTLILSLQYFISALSIWPFVMKHVYFTKPTWGGIKRHIVPNLILFWPVIAVSLYNIMDKLMLGHFGEEEEVAFYTYAERIIQIPLTLILALDNVIMPRMSNLYANHEYDQAKVLMGKVMYIAMFMSAGMAFGMAGVCEVFAPWFYGEAFIRCGFFIKLLSPVIILKGWAGALRTQFIIPRGRDKIYIISLTIGAVLNLVINIMLIPTFGGVGAIIGTIVAEFSVAFVQFFMCRKEIPIKEYMVNGLSFCVIGVIMYSVVNALSSVSVMPVVTMAIQIVIGLIVYILIGVIYMSKVQKNTVLINECKQIISKKYRKI